jgi:hypothetical protein
MTDSSVLDAEVVSLTDARRAELEARQRLARLKGRHDEVRKGRSEAAIAKARCEWGLAGHEWIDAVIACAAAEDRRWRQPAPDHVADTSLSHADQQGDSPEDDLPVTRERVDAKWRAYDKIRRNVNAAPADVDQERHELQCAMLTWFAALAVSKAIEDDEIIADIRRRQELGMSLHPGDAFSAPRPGREYARQQNLYHDRTRYRFQR